jgi:uncharacterized protein YbaP (TraB family)
MAGEAISPALFLVRDADSKLYIYGTVHAFRPGAPWSNEAVRAAILEADEVWTESDASPEAAARESAAFAAELSRLPSTALTARLPPGRAAEVIAAAKSLSVPRASLDRLDPWEAALFMIQGRIAALGRDHSAGVDNQVIALARREGKTLRWLEDMGVAVFKTLPDDVQIEFLLSVVEDWDDAEAQIDQLDAMWRSGDLEGIDALEVAPLRQDYPALYAWIAVERNAAWMDVLINELNGAGVDFVAVGTAHLVGPDSVIAMFEARGYDVERVTAN